MMIVIEDLLIYVTLYHICYDCLCLEIGFRLGFCLCGCCVGDLRMRIIFFGGFLCIICDVGLVWIIFIGLLLMLPLLRSRHCICHFHSISLPTCPPIPQSSPPIPLPPPPTLSPPFPSSQSSFPTYHIFPSFPVSPSPNLLEII